MKSLVIKISKIVLVSMMLFSCNNSASNPSIKNNSNHFEQKNQDDNYSNIPVSKLLIQTRAHYDLDQYDIAKEKLTLLLKEKPDLAKDSTVIDLKDKIEAKILLEKEAKIKAFEENQKKMNLLTSLNNMRQQTIDGTTYYYDLSSPEFDTKECFYAYLTKEGDSIKLNFKTRYIDVDPLNIESCVINVDKLDYTFETPVIIGEIKGKKNYISELLDKEIVSDEDLTLLKAMATGNQITALFVGTKTYAKREISETQRIAIKNVLEVYLSQ